jgi:hypothetical protein
MLVRIVPRDFAADARSSPLNQRDMSVPLAPRIRVVVYEYWYTVILFVELNDVGGTVFRTDS